MAQRRPLDALIAARTEEDLVRALRGTPTVRGVVRRAALDATLVDRCEPPARSAAASSAGASSAKSSLRSTSVEGRS